MALDMEMIVERLHLSKGVWLILERGLRIKAYSSLLMTGPISITTTYRQYYGLSKSLVVIKENST